MDETVKSCCSIASTFGVTEVGMLTWSLAHSGRLDLCWTFVDELFAAPVAIGDHATLASAAIGPVLATYGLAGDAGGFAKSLQAWVRFGNLHDLAEVGLVATGMVLAEMGEADAAVELLRPRAATHAQGSLARACGLYIEADAGHTASHEDLPLDVS